MYVALVISAMIVSGTIIVLMLRNNEEKELVISVKESVNLIRNTISSGSSSEDVDQVMEKLYENSSLELDNKKIFILDNQGKVLYPLRYKEKGIRMSTHQIVGAIEDGYFEEPDKNVTFADDDKNYLGVAENIKFDGDVRYVVYGLIDSSTIDKKVQSTIQIIGMALLSALAVAIIVALIFSTFITKPILALTESAGNLADGTITANIEVHSEDEIGQLTKTFNYMAKNLNNTLNEITSEKNKLVTVFEHMRDGILVFDSNGNLAHLNKTSLKMLGITNETNYQSIFGNYDIEDYKTIRKMSTKGTFLRSLEVGDKYLDIYIGKYNDSYKRQLGIMCVIQDVTHNKIIEKLQKEFVANVSHELRTPITTIKSYSETIIEGMVDSEDTKLDFIKTINKESDRMAHIVTDLLSLTKLDNKQLKLSKKKFDLNDIIDSIVKRFKLITKDTKKNVELIKENKPYTVYGDAERIEQVITNIISNAIKYSEDDGHIVVELKDDNKHNYIAISDDGFGIPKKDLPRIFERFYRIDKARSRDMGGTGLGLSIAKQLMELHDGRIEVASTFGKGSTFTLVFGKYYDDEKK